MFNDFDHKQDDERGRGRMGLSLALSALIFAVASAAFVTVVATARAVVRHQEPEVAVEFAPPPPPPPPVEAPPPPPPVEAPRPQRARTARPAAARDPLAVPTTVPDVRPSESDGELVEATGTGPVEGFTDGGGTAEPSPEPAPPAPVEAPSITPRQQRLEVSPPTLLSGCRSPEVPASVRRSAATIRVLVALTVTDDGSVASARVIEGHPMIPDELVLGCARDQRFSPARLPDGTAVPYPLRRRFVFRPSNL